ncbi:class I histocompatibility antigen, F10 alpha chain-like isoform X3 [Spea bombifrons]|uniref:class I histocompatibility antigen, F10 alpha chain-like isoform X3 n=1 Tax=Spea bombifrons TaxID=233779 RepID=UPI00234BA343|nr:class I histocompatibility antigen, F10 alpha chain-like isoform X3 [Spea bombifrons]
MSAYRGVKMWPLLLIVGVSGVYCGHSLQYYHTAVSAPGHGLPEYTEVGYVDGIQISDYNSDRGRFVPVAQWMEKEGPEYWERQTQISKNSEAVFKRNVRTAMSRFNHTGGVHSVQVMYGCELRDDGSTGGYEQYGYDGGDFLALDTERWVYVPVVAEAQITAQRWNGPEMRWGERRKNYLEIVCIEWLKKYIENGREELERRVAPEVKVSAQTSEGATKLHCQVYGFYPRDVDVNWKRNEIDIPSDEAKQVLPNTDGTYQIRVTVEVTPKEGDSYSCHVDHGSLAEPLIVMWDPRKGGSSSTVYIVIGVVAGIAVAAAVGFILWKRRGRRPVYTPTGTSDGSPAAPTT